MRLTRRDLEVISYLSEEGVALSRQLSKRFFTSDPSFRVRISRLIQEGYVESVSIYQHRHLLRSRFHDLYKRLDIHPTDAPNLRLFRLGRRFKKQSEHGKDIASPSLWQHQISLNELRTYLESFLISGTFITDPELRSEWTRFKAGTEVPIPDLVYRERGVEIAFELERTTKSEVTYFERFADYERSHYKIIVYIAENPMIAERLRRTSRRFSKIMVCELENLRKGFHEHSGYFSLKDRLCEITAAGI